MTLKTGSTMLYLLFRKSLWEGQCLCKHSFNEIKAHRNGRWKRVSFQNPTDYHRKATLKNQSQKDKKREVNNEIDEKSDKSHDAHTRKNIRVDI